MFLFAGCGGGGGGGDSVSSTSPLSLCEGKGNGGKIYGRVYYEDRMYDSLGFTTPRWMPARYTDIELLVDNDITQSKNSIGSTATDSQGRYCIVFQNPKDDGVWLRASAKTDNTPFLKLKVVNVNDAAVYTVLSDLIDDKQSNLIETDLYAKVFLDISTQGPGGAFNILDTSASALIRLRELLGDKEKTLDPLTIRWQSERLFGAGKSGTFGSFFVPVPPYRIDIQGGDTFDTGDHDEYDDDIILHELTHYITRVLWKSDSPGGQHFLDGTGQDLRLAWSEGFASFFSSALRNNSLMVDTQGGYRGSGVKLNFSYDMDNFTVNSTNVIGRKLNVISAASEVALSAALWDMYDANTSPESHDNLALGILPFLDVQYYMLDKSNITLEKFWDGWIEKVGTQYNPEITQIFSDKKIEYFPDSYESDDCDKSTAHSLLRKMQVDTAEHHTLYPAGDSDCVILSMEAGTSYHIKTDFLLNGADTAIFLYDQSSVLLSSNDNANGKDYSACTNTCPPNGIDPFKVEDSPLRSTIVFTPVSSGDYKIIIKRSTIAPPSAGEYGSYDFMVTSVISES